MIVRKLRLQRGWSQEQLAELTGLSVRTIQRIERGQPASLETARALAAVFEVDISTFDTGDQTMIEKDLPTETVTEEERTAIAYVQQLKEFYTHLLLYVVFGFMLLWRRGVDDPVIVWALVGWTAGIIVHALVAFEKINFIGVGWERKMIEKRLGRKL